MFAKRQQLMTLMAGLLLPLGSFAQGTFRVEARSEAYQQITAGLVISTPDEGEDYWDDSAALISLEETFRFPGTTDEYALAMVTTDGVFVLIDLSGQLPPRGLAALDLDLIDRRVLPGSGESDIVLNYENRITKVEWVEATTFCDVFTDGEVNDALSLQVWLHHATGLIEYRYGPNSFSPSSLDCIYSEDEFPPVVGILTADLSGNIQSAYILSGDPANPEITEVLDPNAPLDDILNNIPVNGTTYSFIWDASSSVSELPADMVRIFPNPFASEIQLMSQEVLQNAEVHIYNLQGVPIFSRRGHQDGPISLQHLVPGTYMLEIKSDQGSLKTKIIKQ